MAEKCLGKFMKNCVTGSMTIPVIDVFELIYIENDKSTFFIRHLCQNFINICFGSAFVVSTGQSVKFSCSDKFFILFAIGSDNIKNKQENQNQEYTKEYAFIGFDKSIGILRISNRNYIADHPAVYSESGIRKILCCIRGRNCLQPYSTVFLIFEILPDLF